MTKYNPGDEVKFLNEKGGGTVVRMIDSRMVLVAIEDGFEIPVLLNEVVGVEKPQTRKAPVMQPQDAVREAQARAEAEEKTRKSALRKFAKNPEAEGVYLAFVPHDQQWLLTGLIDVVLVNHTPALLLYSLTLSEENGFFNADYGQVEPGSKLVIETISRDDINHWHKGVVQALLIREQANAVYQPLYAPYDIKAGRFYKEGSYTLSAVLGDKAIMMCLSSLTGLKMEGDIQKTLKEGPAKPEFVKQIVKDTPLIEKHKKATGEAIIDLHIAELVDNIAGLSSHDMFNIQMDYFRKTLDSAMRNDYHKVTYIHGVGNGVLKNAIVDALKSFDDVEQNMASLQKFGVGAIDVSIRTRE